MRRFNVFETLRVADVEIRHSNFLAWLLNPRETHEQGDAFLRAVLQALLAESPSPITRELGQRINSANLRSVTVDREWQHIDLLIRVPSLDLIIAIENKIDASEGDGQLRRYRRIVERERAAHKLFIYLALRDEDINDNQWIKCSHALVLDCIRTVLASPDRSMQPAVGAFIEHYVQILESRVTTNPQQLQLCREIFRKHGEAIKLIMRTVGSPRAHVHDAFAELVEQRFPDVMVVRREDQQTLLVPEVWWRNLPPIRNNATGDDARKWLNFVLEARSRHVVLDIRTRYVIDNAKRNEILRRIAGNGNRWGFRMKFPSWETQRRVQLKIVGKIAIRDWEDTNGQQIADQLVDMFAGELAKLDGLASDLRG